MEQLVESVSWRPAPPLRAMVAYYHGYRQAGYPPAQHRGLPSPYLTLIITFDDPLLVTAHPDPRQHGGHYRTLIGGLHTRPALITRTEREAGIQLALNPLGVPALLGLPASELAGIDLDAAEVFGPTAEEIRERVGAATTWPQRFAVLDEVLLRLTDQDGCPDPVPEVYQAWRRLISTAGTARVGRIAQEVGWSDRHLANRFRSAVGLSPKETARVMRFDRARRRLQRQAVAGHVAPLAELAAATGYYDQAHLAREFRELAGCSPSRWLAEEFGKVQAGAPAEPEPWPA
ncbi:helix-turn-helix domain-containing protein [Amycolatopsis taiwanensis]|uniref:helix-turn-helix domain-containing protein n=1 Tax=Amycolatopsis taiwanensis TaxID=342230 RepID=UPI0025523AE2|nr:helix-turn-helix domain-containing protein [Amycolatopsis taiwanensis]